MEPHASSSQLPPPPPDSPPPTATKLHLATPNQHPTYPADSDGTLPVLGPLGKKQ
jgi:hypothetical protein